MKKHTQNGMKNEKTRYIYKGNSEFVFVCECTCGR